MNAWKCVCGQLLTRSSVVKTGLVIYIPTQLSFGEQLVSRYFSMLTARLFIVSVKFLC